VTARLSLCMLCRHRVGKVWIHSFLTSALDGSEWSALFGHGTYFIVGHIVRHGTPRGSCTVFVLHYARAVAISATRRSCSAPFLASLIVLVTTGVNYSTTREQSQQGGRVLHRSSLVLLFLVTTAVNHSCAIDY
jgi:hypothetical protein